MACNKGRVLNHRLPGNTPSFPLTPLQARSPAAGIRSLLMNSFTLMASPALAPLQAGFRVLAGLREGQITLLRGSQLRCPINNCAACAQSSSPVCVLPAERRSSLTSRPTAQGPTPESHIRQAPIIGLTNGQRRKGTPKSEWCPNSPKGPRARSQE